MNRKFDSEQNNCLCKNDQGLFVPNRQLSLVVAAFLFLFFALFMAGYFLGKRYESLQFTAKMNADLFSDQVRARVIDTPDVSDNSSDHTSFMVSENDAIIDAPIVENSLLADNALLERADNDASPEEMKQYYAPLIGFGTEKAAERFVQKLAAKGIETIVKKHSSKTAKGKVAHWYQVVTVPYTNLQELTVVVNRIIKEETLKGVQISTC